MKRKGLVKAGLVGLSLILGVGALAKSVSDYRQYEKKHTFTATAVAKNDKLSRRLGVPSYRVLIEGGKMILASKVLGFTSEELEYLSLQIEKGTGIDYTGWPDREDPFRIYARKIEPKNLK